MTAWPSHSYNQASLSTLQVLVWSYFPCQAANCFIQFHALCSFFTVLTNAPEGLKKVQSMSRPQTSQASNCNLFIFGELHPLRVIRTTTELGAVLLRSCLPWFQTEPTWTPAPRTEQKQDQSWMQQLPFRSVSPAVLISPGNYTPIQAKCITLHINPLHSKQQPTFNAGFKQRLNKLAVYSSE